MEIKICGRKNLLFTQKIYTILLNNPIDRDYSLHKKVNLYHFFLTFQFTEIVRTFKLLMIFAGSSY